MAHLFGLIGKDIGYSRSPELFQQFFAGAGVEAEYRLFDLPLITSITEVLALQPAGLNVTQPYKQAVIPWLDELDATAKAIEAVNTMAFTGQAVIGYNTDAIGFERALVPLLSSHHTKALILGTGGAALAAAYACRQLGITYRMVSRTPEEDQIGYDSVTPELLATHTLLIQATPIGSARYADERPPLPYFAITSKHLLFDMVYAPPITPFMRAGEEKGAVVTNGLTMLEEQAKAAWEIWRKFNFG